VGCQEVVAADPSLRVGGALGEARPEEASDLALAEAGDVDVAGRRLIEVERRDIVLVSHASELGQVDVAVKDGRLGPEAVMQGGQDEAISRGARVRSKQRRPSIRPSTYRFRSQWARSSGFSGPSGSLSTSLLVRVMLTATMASVAKAARRMPSLTRRLWRRTWLGRSGASSVLEEGIGRSGLVASAR
jgi:hypothetical protein